MLGDEKMTKILLTTSVQPYPTDPWNEIMSDGTAQRFTKGQDIFTIHSHAHCHANHLLAQNISVPCEVLEYPSWEIFTKKIEEQYDFVGISFFPMHMDNVLKMCTHIRKASPSTRILLGSYGAQSFAAAFGEEEAKEYADYVCLGEGIQFLRFLLGEPAAAPISERLLPKCGGTVPWLDKRPKGSFGMLVSGLGCAGGCDFCSTTQLYGQKRHQLLTGKQVAREIKRYQAVYPELEQVMVIEEDHFRVPEHLMEIGEELREDPQTLADIDYLTFGSTGNIQKFAEKHGWEELALTGVGALFIGVESKFAAEHGYDKRADGASKEVFRNLHNIGIRTVGAWMCGWDFHDRNNIHEDLEWFVSLNPTFYQLTRVAPFPGTPFWKKAKEEGRLLDVPWEDVHFWSSAHRPNNFESHELLEFVEKGYTKLYETWGSSITNKLVVHLNGYRFCMNAESEVLREYKSQFHKKIAASLYPFVAACEQFAPNGRVQRRMSKLHEFYRDLLGEPTKSQQLLARYILRRAAKGKKEQTKASISRSQHQEVCKIYRYDKDPQTERESPFPYEVIYPEKGASFYSYKLGQALNRYKLGAVNGVIKAASKIYSTEDVDELLGKRLKEGALSTGL
jgi:haloalkane dehalogenase